MYLRKLARTYVEIKIYENLLLIGFECNLSFCPKLSMWLKASWFLKKRIENCTAGDICKPIYDFCFIDGPKNWTIDGFAFFLVNKLLKNKAWILFDDYLWTYGKHDGRESTDGITVRSLGNEELEEPHIKLIFELLVMQSGEFSNFKIQDNWWAWAQKSKSGSKVLEHTSKMMTKN